MSLYLAIFDNDNEVEGVEVGTYEDFGLLRDTIVQELEAGHAGSRFPTFILHSDCDGSWSVQDCAVLEEELAVMIKELRELPAAPFSATWQQQVAQENGLEAQNLCESFIDVMGQPVLETIAELTRIAQHVNQPILFQ